MADDGRAVLIRPYLETDRSQLETFRCAPDGQSWCRDAEKLIQEAPALIEEFDELVVFVATEGPSVLGAVLFRPEIGFDDRDIIHAIGVVLERQREKIGTRLKLAVMADNAARGPRRSVVSQVHRGNYAMLGLNDKLGVSRRKDPDDGEYYLAAIEVEPGDD